MAQYRKKPVIIEATQCVVGAGFNVIQTAINVIPDKKVLLVIAHTMRYQADMIEQMASSDRH